MKKRFLRGFSLGVCLALAVTGLAACGTGGGFGGKSEFAAGTGTAEDPYVIKEDYQWSNMIKYPEANFVLGGDLNLGDYESVAPIGNAENEFKGTLDGCGYSVKGATVSGDHSVGLFGILSGATIKNLNFTDSVVKMTSGYSDGDYMGSFAAIARKGTVIENCNSKNINMSFVSFRDYIVYAGGFVGSLESVSSTICCSCNVKISLSNGNFPGFYIGGFARSVSGSTVDCCKVTGSMIFGNYATMYVMRIGTLVDKVINGTIKNMSADMNINVGPNIDVYTIAGDIDYESLEYCLNFSSYQRSPEGKYGKNGMYTDDAEYHVLYVKPSEIPTANAILKSNTWKDNKYWKEGKLYPELVSYEEYLQIKEAESAE